ncbi:hypothetical protein GS399_04885 [Pedobacter sp. HMF7647]|uniref:AIM24 family protein n=1 Tax=Hufsiella arboris TaxID=2695275 RepID=A0A7K1Y8C1_9SPHI|nr:hypothetical protein [Hufsiella arboris]MXV50298.1 hypothetical protein [Hufsiella arboris]
MNINTQETMTGSIFHSGEKFVQELSGEKFIAQRNSGIISDTLNAGEAIFIRSQKFFFASSMDSRGNAMGLGSGRPARFS